MKAFSNIAWQGEEIFMKLRMKKTVFIITFKKLINMLIKEVSKLGSFLK